MEDFQQTRIIFTDWLSTLKYYLCHKKSSQVHNALKHVKTKEMTFLNCLKSSLISVWWLSYTRQFKVSLIKLSILIYQSMAAIFWFHLLLAVHHHPFSVLLSFWQTMIHLSRKSATISVFSNFLITGISKSCKNKEIWNRSGTIL